MSIGPAILLLSAFIGVGPIKTFQNFARNPVLLSISLVFLLYLLSGVQSSNNEYWLERLRVKIPFLVVPLAIAGLPALSKNTLQRILAFFLGIATISAIIVASLYLMRYDYYTSNYITGTVMPTPLNHIRYSLILAFAVATGCWLLYSKWNKDKKWVQVLISLAALFILAFLHVLAVRSGLLAVYLVLLYWFVFLLFSGRKLTFTLSIALLVGAGLWAAFSFVPTLKNKVAYAKYDMEHFLKGEVNTDFSDAKRLASIHTGWAVGRKYPVTGVGIGDIKESMEFEYRKHYPDLVDNDPLPHNQFVLIFASMGLIGLLVFFWSIGAPLLLPGAMRDPLLITFLLVSIPSLLTETTFETQLGVTFYITFLCLILHQKMSGVLSSKIKPK